jgi:hypothetical protein
VIKKSLLRDLFTLVDVSNTHFFNISDLVDDKWQTLQNMTQEEKIALSEKHKFDFARIKTRADVWCIIETQLEVN